MDWLEKVNKVVQQVSPIIIDEALIRRIYSLIDLTSLNESDTESSIAFFSEKALSSLGHVAAVCVYPTFVRQMSAQFFNTAIKVATVVNFPEGDLSLEMSLIEIGRALQDGAQEIDVVFPYQRYLAGERQYAQRYISSCKAACGEHVLLKVILETGALQDIAIIADATYDAIAAGADFVKTSTGKIPEGATLEAVATMLLVVKHSQSQVKRTLGVKVSGGVRTAEDAVKYLELAKLVMGRDWAMPATFRIGASKLVDELLQDAG